MNPNSPCCRPLLAKYPSKSLSSLPTPIPANPPLSLQLPLRPHEPSLSSVNPPVLTNTSGDSARNRAGEKDKAGTAPSTRLWTGLGTVPGTAQSLLVGPGCSSVLQSCSDTWWQEAWPAGVGSSSQNCPCLCPCPHLHSYPHPSAPQAAHHVGGRSFFLTPR